MKTYQPVLITSVTAAADTVKHRFIGFGGALCGADQKALGVSDADTKSGQQMPVVVVGIALVEASGAISQGARVFSDANGKATATGTNNPNGHAVDSATGAGEIIRVRLI